MSPKVHEIDISENRLRHRGRVLEILLSVHNTKKNIIWATDSYSKRGNGYLSKNRIKRENITDKHGFLIQPRASKSKDEQKYRTKVKAEVFTPLNIVRDMNMEINWAGGNWPANRKNWQNFISERRLEITCGEGPFIASRYNPVNGNYREVHRRVGFLDYKLRVVGEFVNNKKDWLKYAEVALKSSYGYEWQGDNLLIARENILLTLDDFYKDFCKRVLKLKSKQNLSDEQLEHFAEIIAWNFWQMDGLKYVAPMSCRGKVIKNDILTMVDDANPEYKDTIEENIKGCPGCVQNDPLKHNGEYAKIMDWETGKPTRFVDLLKEKS